MVKELAGAHGRIAQVGFRNGALPFAYIPWVRTQVTCPLRTGKQEHLVYLPGPEEKERSFDERTAAFATGK